MKILKKIFNFIINIIMIIALIIMLISVYAFVQVNFMNKDVPNLFGYTILQVNSGSMGNALKVDDIILVDLLDDNEEIKVDDIISFKENNAIITHRVKKIDEDKIIAQGDSNNIEDTPITREQVIGKVCQVNSKIGIWINVFKTKEVYVMLAITTILLIITSCIGTEEKENKEETKEKTEDNNE